MVIRKFNGHSADRPIPAHADAPAAPRGAIRRVLATLRTWQVRVRTRRQLLTFNDRMLADIGLSRVDADREAAKPFWKE